MEKNKKEKLERVEILEAEMAGWFGIFALPSLAHARNFLWATSKVVI